MYRQGFMALPFYMDVNSWESSGEKQKYRFAAKMRL